MTNTSTADTMNLRELNPEELNSVSGGLREAPSGVRG